MSTTQENLLFRITVEQTGSSIQQIDQLTKSLTSLGTASKGLGGAGAGGFQNMLNGINMSAKELNTTLTSLNTNFNKMNSGAATAGMSKLSSSTQQASSALQAGTRAAEGFAAGMGTASKGVTTVIDQLGLYKNAATSASSAANVLTAGFEKFATAGAMAEKNMFGVTNTLSTFGRQADSAAASAQKLGQAENSATAATQRMTQASEAANVASQTGLGYDKERAAQWVNNIRHISGTALSFMSLYQAMDSVQGIGEMVALQSEKVTDLQEKENQAIAQYGKDSKQAVAAHEAVAKAQRGLAYEQREANFAMHNMLFMVGLIVIELTNSLLPILLKAGAALKGLNASTTVAATGVSTVAESLASSVPGFNMFTLGGNKAKKAAVEMAEGMAGSAPKIGYVGEGLKGVSRTATAAAPDLARIGETAVNMGAGVLMGAEATTKMSLGQKIMSAASKIGMVALGGLGVSAGTAAIATLAAGTAGAAAAVGLALYGTNAFGARDAMNAMGVEIGKVNPVFKTIGDLAVVVAGKLGLTGENAVKAQGHITDLGRDFSTLSTIWNDVVADMQQSDNIIVKDMGNMLSLIGTDLKTMAGHFTAQVGASVSTWQKLTDALEKHDYKAVVNIIGQALGAIPGIVQQIFVDVGKVFLDFEKGQLAFWKNLWSTISPAISAGLTTLGQMFQKGLEALVGISTEVLKRVVTALGLDPVIAAVQKGVQTVVATFNGIVKGITDMGADIMKKILGTGDLTQQTQAWINNNIIAPINGFVKLISVTAADIWKKITESGGDVGGSVGTWITNSIVNPINQLYTQVTDQAGKIVDGILKSDVGAKVTKWAQDVVAKLMAPFSNIGKNVGDAVGGAGDAIQKGAVNWYDALANLGSGGKKPPTGAPAAPSANAPLTGKALDSDKVLHPEKYPSMSGPANATPVAFGGQPPGAGYQFAGLTGTITPGPTGTKTGGPASPTGSSLGDLASVSNAPQVQHSAPPAGAAGKKPEVTLTPPMVDESTISSTNKAYQELDNTVKELQTSYNDYGSILNTTRGIEDLQKKGTLEQQTAYQGMQAALITSKSANEEYGKQVQRGNILTTSFNQGIEDEKKALLDEQVELKNSQGRHAELANQMSTTGVPQITAFNQGMDEQVGALQQQQLATAKSAGTIQQLGAQMADGSAQTAAYGEGFVGATLAIDQQEVALSNTSGTIDAYTTAISNGRLASIAYSEGINQQRQALIDNYTAMNQAQGGLDEYNQQLTTGIPQALAFKTALLQQQMATAKLQEDTYALAGTMQGMFDDLSNGQTLIDMNTKAFYEGGKAAVDWGTELATADAKQDGLMQGLSEVANKLGVSTQGFIGNADQLQEWIGIMTGAGDAVEEMGHKLYEGGVQMMSKFDEAIASGGKGAKDELDKIEEEIGVNFPSGIKDALEAAGLQDTMVSQLTKMLEAGERAVSHADPQAMAQYIDKIKGKAMEGLANLDAATQQKASAVIAQLSNTLAQGPTDSSAQAYSAWAAKISGYLDQIKRAGDPAYQSMKPLTTMTFSEQPTEAVQGLIQAMSNNQPLSAYQQSLLNIANSLPDAAGNTNDLAVSVQNANGQFVPAATSLTGLGTAAAGTNTQMQTFLTTMGTMEGVVQQVVANVQQQFTEGFNATWTALNASTSTFLASFVSLFNTNIASLATPLAQLVQAFQITFSTVLQNAGTLMQQLVQKVQQGIQQITTVVNTLVSVFNNAFSRGVNDAAGYLNQLVQKNNQTFQQITATVQKIVGVFNDSFKRASNDAAGYVKQLGTVVSQVMQSIVQKAGQAAQAIAKIGSSAKSAQSAVRSLANEINSLKDKTVTITVVTRRVTVGAASGMAPTMFMGNGGQVTSDVYGDTMGTRNSRVIVGESGDETVLRTGMKSRQTRVDNVRHIKYISGLGAKEPEMLTVIPLEGTNAQQFRNSHPEYYAEGTPGIYNAGSYPTFQNPTSPGRQLPSGFSQMLYGRIKKDRHGNITIGGRLIFRAGGPLDIDAYEGRHISHGSHGDPDDRHHFREYDGSNEDIKHQGIPFTFGSENGFQVVKGMETGIGGTRGQVVGRPVNAGQQMTANMLDEIGAGDVPSASMDRMAQSRRVYSEYISDRVAAARDRPRTQQQDSVYGNVDNQGNPMMTEYNENAYPTGIEPDTPLIHPHSRSNITKPTRSYQEDYEVFIAKLINEVTRKIDGKIKINLHSQVDTRIWGKITNEQVLNDMIRS